MSDQAVHAFVKHCLERANALRTSGLVTDVEALEALASVMLMAVASCAAAGYEAQLLDHVIDALRKGLPLAIRDVLLARLPGGVPQGRA
jgi:hypothetical protein